MSNLTYAKYMTKNSTNPVPNWLFNVSFRMHDNSIIEDGLNELECINIGLPENETTTSEVHFFGSSMTVPSKRKYSGEITAEFFDKKGNTDTLLYLQTNGNESQAFSNRKEFQFKLDKIIIDVYPMSIKTIYKRYTLYNPVITKMNYTEGLDTSGESALKYSINIHYDYWNVEQNIPNLNIDKEE